MPAAPLSLSAHCQQRFCCGRALAAAAAAAAALFHACRPRMLRRALALLRGMLLLASCRMVCWLLVTESRGVAAMRMLLKLLRRRLSAERQLLLLLALLGLAAF